MSKVNLKLGQIFIAATLLALPFYSVAEEDDVKSDSDELNIIQVELDKETSSINAQKERAQQEEEKEQNKNQVIEKEPAKSKPLDFEALGKLSEFSDVSVLQKKYLPKTQRFQAFAGLTAVTNDPFYNTFGVVGKLGYFLTESWGLELNYFSLNTSEAKSTKELRNISGVSTDNLVTTKNFSAVDVVWVPIYGKMAFFGQAIVPFDLYFSLGYGQTGTANESVPTIHTAAGQIFALTKASALRWDFSWNFFNAKGLDQQSSNYNNLFLTFGYSFFFPEAKYR